VLVDQHSYDDAGVYRLDAKRALVQTVDFFTPVVDDPYDYGRIAAANALSDVYAMGGTPLTALALVGFPDTRLEPWVLGEILRGGRDTMDRARVAIVGGHSVKDAELKFGYSVTGLVDPKRLLTNAAVRPGDRILLTKPLGTGVLATALKHGRLAPALVRRITLQMASLNRDASVLALRHGARAATDVTGFGLVGHAAQMARASGVTLRLAPRADWFLPRTLELAAAGEVAGGLRNNRAYYAAAVSAAGVDPTMELALYDPQTSGGLLIAIGPRKFEALARALRGRRIWHRVLGDAVKRGPHDLVLAA